MRVITHFLAWRLGLAPARTETTVAERDALASHASGRRRLAEIGVWHGVTTRRLRQVMAGDAVLYAVDPYPAGRLGVSLQRIIARSEVGRVRRGTVRWLRTTGADASRLVSSSDPVPPDFVFIDGDHSFDGVRADWEAWSPLVAAGGIIALHDSRSSPGRPLDDVGSVAYTREVVRSDPRFNLVDEVESLSVFRRTQAAHARVISRSVPEGD